MSSGTSVLSIEQIAFYLKKLPKKDIEKLDLLLDDKFRDTILERGKTAWQEYRNGETLSHDQIKKEFGV